MRAEVCAVLALATFVVPSAARAQDIAPADARFPDGYEMGPLGPGPSIPALGGGPPLRLTDVLASVRAHHPPLEALEARVRAAEGRVLAADGAFDATLAASGTLSVFGYYEYGRLDVSVTQATPLYGASFFAGWRIGRPVDENNYFPDYYGEYRTLDGGELRAGLTVPLLRDGWTDSRRAGVARAAQARDAAQAELDARLLRVQLAATEAYLSWLAAGRKLEIALALLALAEERDAQLERRVRAGALAAIEHLENRRAVLERRQAIVASVRALERAAISLSLYFRDETGAPRTVDPSRIPSLELDVVEAIALDEDGALDRALAERPELRRWAAARASAEVSRDLAENQILPRLDLTFAASIDVGSSDSESDRTTLGPPVGTGMLTFSWPLFMRAGIGGRDAAAAELGAVTAESELARDQIALEVRDAFSALRAAYEALALAEESQRVAAAVAAAERARFEAGASSLLIVNLREALAAQAASAFIDARVGLERAEALVIAVTGGL